ARLVLPREGASRTGAPAYAPSRGNSAIGAPRSPAAPSDVLPREAAELFEALRRLRSELARAENVPAYVVASDRALREIALLRPRGLHALQLAHGIGPAKAERYGARILAVVARAGEGA